MQSIIWCIMQDFSERFTGRAEAYSKYRPTYPREIINILVREIGFDSTKIVADIGSGTGILSRLFLENGNVVLGIEPNNDMRSFAESNLASFPKFSSINGTAEDTSLDDQSVDLLCVGQALHWFDPKKSRVEFKRILKKDGYFLVAYNDRSKGQEGFGGSFDSLVVEARAKNSVLTGDHYRVDDGILDEFFERGCKKFLFSNEQKLDYEGVLGRAYSSSYWPRPDQSEYATFQRRLGEIFAKFQKEGSVTIFYDTTVLFGSI
ncbi:MAG: class I SAM-dependent methyltransferase [Nitrososphaerales archaeon]